VFVSSALWAKKAKHKKIETKGMKGRILIQEFGTVVRLCAKLIRKRLKTMEGGEESQAVERRPVSHQSTFRF